VGAPHEGERAAPEQDGPGRGEGGVVWAAASCGGKMGAMPPSTHSRFACDERFPARQVLRLCRRAIVGQGLDLRGLRVLTEATVGYRRVAPVIAALAGADEVHAVSRDTAQAARKEAEAQTAWLATAAGVRERIHLVPTRLQAPLRTIDVVTDLPGVRPIDESIVRNLSDRAVVTLMRGVAFWQPADVDVGGCRRVGIAVAGVDEEAVGIHPYVPLATLWGLTALGVEAVGGTVMVAGAGVAYPYVVRALSQLGARVLVAAPEPAGRIVLYGGRKVGDSLAEGAVLDRLAEADALVLSPAAPGERLLGPGTALEALALAEAAPHLAVVCGATEAEGRALVEAGLRVWPAPSSGEPAALDELLPRPTIDLLVAGFKVGEVMARARRAGSSPVVAEQAAAREAKAELLPQDLGSARR
jgi:hypothetical protein